MTRRATIGLAAGVLVLVAGLGTGVAFVSAQGQGQKFTPTTVAFAADPKDKPLPAPVEPKNTDTVQRERVAKMIVQVDAELEKLKKAAPVEGDDPNALRERLRTLEVRQSELLNRVQSERLTIPQELSEAMDAAHQRLDAAKKAMVPAEVLAEAGQSHPKVVEAQAKLSAKEEEVRASKLPKDDAGRKKLNDERVALFKELQTVQKQVGPEVEAYLRAPGVVEAKKAVATMESRVRQIEMKVIVTREEYEMVVKEVMTLRQQLKAAEPAAEELAWLKEKRKRLKQELLELELKEAGIGNKS